MKPKGNAFTLIELLIVVAIIAILAAIAVPNFLEAQVRSKVSRGKADMRSMATAIETYKVDFNQYPMDFQFYQLPSPWGIGDLNDWRAAVPLVIMTTPIAYMTSLPFNVFRYEHGAFDGDPRHYGYKADLAWRNFIVAFNLAAHPEWDQSKHWALMSVGPDQTTNAGEWYMFGEEALNSRVPAWGGGPGCLYDPTNGSVSWGDIVRVGP